MRPRSRHEGHGVPFLDHLGPNYAVVGVIGLGQRREARGVLRPWKFSAIDDKTACCGRMPAEIFRGGINHYGGAEIERTTGQGKSSVVDDKRNAGAEP